MPVSRYFTVTQEREVKIRAPDPLVAAQIASEAFLKDEGVHNDAGSTTTEVKVRSIEAREDY